MRYNLLTFILLALLMACSGGEQAGATGDTPVTTQVKVYKYDGSVQCEPQSGISLDEMKKQLTDAGIAVSCPQKGHDGKARIQACGTDTGILNVYTISESDAPKAMALGFADIQGLPDHHLDVCQQ